MSWEDFTRATALDFEGEYSKAKAPIPTYLPGLDPILSGGLVPGIHVIGGEPGAGKSALALYVSLHMALKGLRIAYVSLEMGRMQCMYRMLSCYSMRVPELVPFRWTDAAGFAIADNRAVMDAHKAGGDPLEVARDRRANNPVIAAYERLTGRLRACGGGVQVVDDRRFGSVLGFPSFAKELAGDECSAIVIDYLQQMGDEGDPSDEYTRVSAASKALSAAAHDYDIPVIVLAALNRSAVTQGGEPTMHGFRGSSGIEYDAETAIVLANGGEDRASQDREVLLHVVKNRHGRQTGGCPLRLAFDGGFNQFAAYR